MWEKMKSRQLTRSPVEKLVVKKIATVMIVLFVLKQAMVVAIVQTLDTPLLVLPAPHTITAALLQKKRKNWPVEKSVAQLIATVKTA
jgi:hypothetical protein